VSVCKTREMVTGGRTFGRRETVGVETLGEDTMVVSGVRDWCDTTARNRAPGEPGRDMPLWALRFVGPGVRITGSSRTIPDGR
jgi:hypothetical protein